MQSRRLRFATVRNVVYGQVAVAVTANKDLYRDDVVVPLEMSPSDRISNTLAQCVVHKNLAHMVARTKRL